MSADTNRIKTGNFLDGFAQTGSFQLQGQGQFYTETSDQLTTGNLGPTGVTDQATSVISNNQQNLTGARPAILPMQISAIGKNNNRLSFILLINPASWNHGKTTAYQSTYTREGWIPQLWGPNQDTISSTGRSAAFLTSTGLDNFNKEFSYGYLNLLSLVGAYKNNGYIFEDFAKMSGAARMNGTLRGLGRIISMVSGIEIKYDNNTFIGHFNTFTLDEDDEHPYTQNYNFDFITSTLTGDETQIRGHYKRIPISKQDLEMGTALDPNYKCLVSHATSKAPSMPVASKLPSNKPPSETLVGKDFPIAPSGISSSDRVTKYMYEKVTGLPWSKAVSLHLTDGTMVGNLELRQLLEADKDSNSNREVIKESYKKMTGLSWDEAIKQGLVTNSASGFMDARNNLLTKKWDSSERVFK